MTAWARIYRPLKDLLPASQYHFGMNLERIEEDANGITAVFSDGTTARGDLLVAVNAQFAGAPIDPESEVVLINLDGFNEIASWRSVVRSASAVGRS